LIARLGLRAGDVIALRSDDLDWQRGSLRVAGKGRRQSVLPLPQEVGDAILAYLEHSYLPGETRHVFTRVHAPRGPLATSGAVSHIVMSAMRRAGVQAPSRAHALRHSAATAMLRGGISLETIATVLRHRSCETTAHYAKVDVVLLGQIAQPWPEVAPC
jgi:integrase